MKQGNQFHIESFFKENYSRLFYFAYKIVEDRAAAEDVVQDVFLKMWKQNIVTENEMAAKSYVYTAIRNTCYNLLRDSKVKRKFTSAFSNNQVEENEKGLDLIIRAEVIGQIQRAIEALPEGCRTVLKLAYFESLKNEEIAKHLGVSINTVKTQKARALQLLRLRLDTPAFLLFLFICQGG